MAELTTTEMEYPRRLLAAAEIVLQSDQREQGTPFLDPAHLGVTATLKSHQLEGVSWLLRRYHLGVNVLLGDEMGLGKTLQAMSLLSYLKVNGISTGPFLVLCPLSVTDSWMSEFAKFCPILRVLRYLGDKERRRDLRRMMHEHVQKQPPSINGQTELPFDVLLTTYDVALLDQDFLSQIPWHYAVIDEAQRLKNPSSVLYRVLQQNFTMPRRLLMTGTPIQNNLTELWALMHFCMPAVFGTLEQFTSTFYEDRSSTTGYDADGVEKQFKILKHILRAFMLRRTKRQLVESGTLMLPPLTEITMMLPLVPLQKKVYMSILRRELPTLLAFSSGAPSHQSLQNIVVQLRKACSHPYLFIGIEPEPYEEGEHLILASSKLIVLDQLLKRLRAEGHRVLLFAQMTHTLDILQDFLELRKYTYERLDGSVRAEERFAAIRSFSLQPPEGPVKPAADSNDAFVFMISTRAGGVGLNLVAADTVIFYEQDWNPQVDKQALQRAHRIGQMKHVLSINLVTEHSIEEVIMRRAERKLNLSNNVVGQKDDTQEGGKLVDEAVDMRSLIVGLQMFDPTDVTAENLSEQNIADLNAMVNKVIEMRKHETSQEGQRFEINPANLFNNELKKSVSDSAKFNSVLDEAAYSSWVEKFREASKSIEASALSLGKRRNVLDETQPTREAQKKKAAEKKLAKWEALGYKSLAVKDPDHMGDDQIVADSGSVQFVYGDCTKPSSICSSEPAIIFSCVDTSGNWGRGGMFDALASLSSSIPDAYRQAFECSDLHMGDLHLIHLTSLDGDSNTTTAVPLLVALAVVQSYNPRRKVPRSNISVPDLERCLAKASFAAAQKSASIHMPRIGYQDGSHRSEWYTVERLLRKYASIHGIKIYVYYFRRPSKEEHPQQS
ncbi:DNA helicase protein [Dioscorea alata]|uniref:DNA helicase protein n=2 Tax=Dioscorea alata TaxID=55571 RepID=A0ACB7WIT0_DIOAL|nr:DNA helicase protein [Dioscorea alata]